jgi:SAM-dependent methyltransferase
MSPREVVRATLHHTGMLGVARRVRELGWTMKFAGANRRFLATAPQPLPIPPARLRILVAASPDIAWFVESGLRGADSIRSVLDRNHIALAESLPLLDFGCGCGRVTRHFASFGDAVYGTDLHPALAGWCRDRLGFGHFAANGLEPPLPFADRQFGLVYALSVFTHLPELLQRPWIEELRRVLRPGGHLVFTTHGVRYVDELAADDRAKFAAGQLAIKRADRPGSNVCGAYHPEAYVRGELSRGFSVVEHAPEGAAGNPWQDLWLLRRL